MTSSLNSVLYSSVWNGYFWYYYIIYQFILIVTQVPQRLSTMRPIVDVQQYLSPRLTINVHKHTCTAKHSLLPTGEALFHRNEFLHRQIILSLNNYFINYQSPLAQGLIRLFFYLNNIDNEKIAFTFLLNLLQRL